jgi:hypothetical protein
MCIESPSESKRCHLGSPPWRENEAVTDLFAAGVPVDLDGINLKRQIPNRPGKLFLRINVTRPDPDRIVVSRPARLNLQSWLPNRLFKPINHVLVGFGQVVCLPVGPRCDVCLLAKEKICPARTIGGNYKGRKEVGVSFEDVGVVFKHDGQGAANGVVAEMPVDTGKGVAKVEIKIEEEGVE